ncbi:MAG: hypothetical protein AUI15_32045 [Actinobacteria bacterium 13_2_20CM_2_66_6]|nr:MAG: hypothetical protein AUI15_32045 [Actinobacteria bacterium 13_2_20CM_2_66_6]
MFLTDAPLVERRQVARDMWVLGFAAPDIAASVKAGQFVNIGMRPGPLLRRPFSVYRAGDDRIEVLLKAVGVGTAQMLAMREGDVASCLGPLGRGFDLTLSAKTVSLVSGGLGVAPMPLAARDARAAGLQVTWVHGARTADELCSETEGDEVILATDDGSAGFAGTVVAAAPDADLVLACGPNRMRAPKALSTSPRTSTGRRCRLTCPMP